MPRATAAGLPAAGTGRGIADCQVVDADPDITVCFIGDGELPPAPVDSEDGPVLFEDGDMATERIQGATRESFGFV
jgi:hypothetical protein